jgi:nicotinamidase-related amidase
MMDTDSRSKKFALLVVDVQVGVMRNAWKSQEIIKNISVVVEKARAALVPVIWVQHNDDELVLGSPDWQIVPELSPTTGEIKIDKHYNSSFEGTSLQESLTALGVNYLVLVGAASNWCIRATAFGALERGYKLTLIEDAHTTEHLEYEDGTIIEAKDIIKELNTSMKWLSYPGNPNQVANAEEISFLPFQ